MLCSNCHHKVAEHEPTGPCTECTCRDWELATAGFAAVELEKTPRTYRTRQEAEEDGLTGPLEDAAERELLKKWDVVWIACVGGNTHYVGDSLRGKGNENAYYTVCGSYYTDNTTYYAGDYTKPTCSACIRVAKQQGHLEDEVDSVASGSGSGSTGTGIKDWAKNEDLNRGDHFRMRSGWKYHYYNGVDGGVCGIWLGDYESVFRWNDKAVDCAKCTRWLKSRGMTEHLRSN